MFDFLMTPEQLALRDEAREMAKWVPRQYILDMDADKIKFPKEFLQECGRRNLLGLRLPKSTGDEAWAGWRIPWWPRRYAYPVTLSGVSGV